MPGNKLYISQYINKTSYNQRKRYNRKDDRMERNY